MEWRSVGRHAACARFFKYNQVLYTVDGHHDGWSTINEWPFKNERGHICTAGYRFLNRIPCDEFVWLGELRKTMRFWHSISSDATLHRNFATWRVKLFYFQWNKNFFCLRNWQNSFPTTFKILRKIDIKQPQR